MKSRLTSKKSFSIPSPPVSLLSNAARAAFPPRLPTNSPTTSFASTFWSLSHKSRSRALQGVLFHARTETVFSARAIKPVWLIMFWRVGLVAVTFLGDSRSPLFFNDRVPRLVSRRDKTACAQHDKTACAQRRRLNSSTTIQQMRRCHHHLFVLVVSAVESIKLGLAGADLRWGVVVLVGGRSRFRIVVVTSLWSLSAIRDHFGHWEEWSVPPQDLLPLLNLCQSHRLEIM